MGSTEVLEIFLFVRRNNRIDTRVLCKFAQMSHRVVRCSTFVACVCTFCSRTYSLDAIFVELYCILNCKYIYQAVKVFNLWIMNNLAVGFILGVAVSYIHYYGNYIITTILFVLSSLLSTISFVDFFSNYIFLLTVSWVEFTLCTTVVR